jgi:hypothetical protein
MTDLREAAALPSRGDPKYVQVGSICLIMRPGESAPSALGLVVRVGDLKKVASLALVSLDAELITDQDLPLTSEATGLPSACVIHAGIWASVFYDQIGKAIAFVDGDVLDQLSALSLGETYCELPDGGDQRVRVEALVALAHELSSAVLNSLLEEDEDEEDDPSPAWQFVGTKAGFFADLESFLAEAREAGVLVGSLAVHVESGIMGGRSSGSYEIEFELRSRVGLGAVLRATVGHGQLHVTLEYVDDGASRHVSVACVVRPDGGVNTEPLVPSPTDATTLKASLQWSHAEVPETIWLAVGPRG